MNNSDNTGRKKYDTYLVTDEGLLYELARCSQLDKLCGVVPSRKVEGTRVWFFDKDECVGTIIKHYKEQKRSERMNREDK